MSYGRIHAAFFDSSINDAEPETRLVFIAMIVLSDRHGRIDVTRAALARRLNLAPAAIDRAIDVLSAPDTLSRTPDHDGRRIIPLDGARSWGWQVVNKEQYRGGDTVDAEEARLQSRDRKRRQREREKNGVPESSSSRSSNTKDKDTPGVTVTGGHAASQPRHAASHTERDTFERLWLLVPRKEGKNEARKHFAAFLAGTCKADPDKSYAGNLDRLAADVETAIRTYAAKVKAEVTESRYIKHGASLIYNFQDYVAYQPPTLLRQRGGEPRPEGLQGVVL